MLALDEIGITGIFSTGNVMSIYIYLGVAAFIGGVLGYPRSHKGVTHLSEAAKILDIILSVAVSMFTAFVTYGVLGLLPVIANTPEARIAISAATSFFGEEVLLAFGFRAIREIKEREIKKNNDSK